MCVMHWEMLSGWSIDRMGVPIPHIEEGTERSSSTGHDLKPRNGIKRLSDRLGSTGGLGLPSKGKYAPKNLSHPRPI